MYELSFGAINLGSLFSAAETAPGFFQWNHPIRLLNFDDWGTFGKNQRIDPRLEFEPNRDYD